MAIGTGVILLSSVDYTRKQLLTARLAALVFAKRYYCSYRCLQYDHEEFTSSLNCLLHMKVPVKLISWKSQCDIWVNKDLTHWDRWTWTATSDRARTRQRTQAMIFPSHASNTPRHGRYLRLKMARFREQRWAYARSWLRCDWTSLSYREGKLNLPPPPTDRERVQRVNIRTYFYATQRLLCILSMFTNSLLYAA